LGRKANSASKKGFHNHFAYFTCHPIPRKEHAKMECCLTRIDIFFVKLFLKWLMKDKLVILWLIYLDLATVAADTLAAGTIVAQNVRYTSASTAEINFQQFKIQ
jgi:hypothetical protein